MPKGCRTFGALSEVGKRGILKSCLPMANDIATSRFDAATLDALVNRSYGVAPWEKIPTCCDVWSRFAQQLEGGKVRIGKSLRATAPPFFSRFVCATSSRVSIAPDGFPARGVDCEPVLRPRSPPYPASAFRSRSSSCAFFFPKSKAPWLRLLSTNRLRPVAFRIWMPVECARGRKVPARACVCGHGPLFYSPRRQGGISEIVRRHVWEGFAPRVESPAGPVSEIGGDHSPRGRRKDARLTGLSGRISGGPSIPRPDFATRDVSGNPDVRDLRSIRRFRGGGMWGIR